MHASRFCGAGIGATCIALCTQLYSTARSNSLPTTLSRQPTRVSIVPTIGICGASKFARLFLGKVRSLWEVIPHGVLEKSFFEE